jgi:serine/threonine protein kinase
MRVAYQPMREGDLPATLGPYRLVRRIGQGGMAEVHLAVRYGASGFEKVVAIKLLRREHRGRASSSAC